MNDAPMGKLVRLAVQGDFNALRQLAEVPPASVEALEKSLPHLVLTKDTLLRVLLAWQRQAVSAKQVQRWASFIRRGYLGFTTEPRRPIDIQYEEAAEDEIVEVISRLDEIGDLVDGAVSDLEVSQMVQRLRAN